MSLRLFIALPVPDAIASELVLMQRGIPNAKWRPRENLHITLRFVGMIDEAMARDLDEVLATITMGSMPLEIFGAGTFGNASPESVWLGVTRTDHLDILAGRCERACRRIGLAPDTRKWFPHVTMAYLNSAADPARAASFVQSHATYRSPQWEADRFHLYSSWTGKGPSRYIAEAEYPLIS